MGYGSVVWVGMVTAFAARMGVLRNTCEFEIQRSSITIPDNITIHSDHGRSLLRPRHSLVRHLSQIRCLLFRRAQCIPTPTLHLTTHLTTAPLPRLPPNVPM